MSMVKKLSWVFDHGGLFKIACDAASRIDASPRSGNQGSALISIVFSVLTVEAFVNELAEFASSTTLEKPSGIDVLAEFLMDAERSNASLETKLAVSTWILSGKRFERGEQPFQDFALLVRLRNDVVHFKANDRFEEGEPTGSRHANLIAKFKDKKMLAEDAEENEISSWSRLIKTKAVAQWSCLTAARMIMDFYDKIPVGDFRTCIVPSPEYYNPKVLFSESWGPRVGRKVKYHCDVCGWHSEWMSDNGSE